MFALSPVFKLTDSVKAGGVSITSTPANASFGYVTGETIRVQVDFGEAMTVTGSPYLVLDVGGQVRRATYESGAGTRYLVFAYGVARGETDADGVSLCTDTMMDANCGRIALDGGAIAAQSDSFAAELDLPSLGNQGRHKVDATPTRVRGLTITSTPTNATPGYAANETIQVRLDFGEAASVTGTGTPSVVLNIGRVARRAVYASGSGTRHLDFEYTVQAGGLRFGRHFAVLGHVPGSGLRTDFAQWREHLCSVRLPRGRTRPAGAGQPVGAQGRRGRRCSCRCPLSAGRCPTRVWARCRWVGR